LLALQRDVVIETNYFGADETPLEIGMNDTRCLRRSRALFDGPGAHFFDARREIGLQSEQGVTRTNHTIKTGLFQTEIFEEISAIRIIEL